jgi:hypothetical protein
MSRGNLFEMWRLSQNMAIKSKRGRMSVQIRSSAIQLRVFIRKITQDSRVKDMFLRTVGNFWLTWGRIAGCGVALILGCFGVL